MDKKTALIIIDVQNQFLREHSLNIPVNIADFVKDNRQNIKLIARCSYINSTDSLCCQDGFTSCFPGEYSAALCEGIKDADVDLDMEKGSYAIPDTLARLLIQGNFEQVFLCGFSTNCCVLASMFKLYDNNINVYMISDLCQASSMTKHKNGILCAQACFGEDRVITVEKAAKMLPNTSAGESEKVIAERIDQLKSMEHLMSLSKSDDLYSEWHKTLPADSVYFDYAAIAENDAKFRKCCSVFAGLIKKKDYCA